MNPVTFRAVLADVRHALVEPESFARKCHEERHLDWRVWVGLAATAALGTTLYGMTMGILGGTTRVIETAVLCTAACGLAWLIPLPGLYVTHSLFGSRLSLSSTLIAVLVTVSFGGVAMLASIPMNWFFTAAVPVPWFVLVVNIVVFAGVGTSMTDVFGRVMQALEPERRRTAVWLLLPVAAIGVELFVAFGLFRFAAHAA